MLSYEDRVNRYGSGAAGASARGYTGYLCADLPEAGRVETVYFMALMCTARTIRREPRDVARNPTAGPDVRHP